MALICGALKPEIGAIDQFPLCEDRRERVLRVAVASFGASFELCKRLIVHSDI